MKLNKDGEGNKNAMKTNEYTKSITHFAVAVGAADGFYSSCELIQTCRSERKGEAESIGRGKGPRKYEQGFSKIGFFGPLQTSVNKSNQVKYA